MEILKKILHDKEHAGIQFLKYVTCGGIAFLVDFSVFYYIAIKVLPALTPDDVIARLLGLDPEPISTHARLSHYWICIFAGFVISNVVAYVLNVLFVFRGGKHKVHHEIALFFAVSMVAFLLSSVSGDLLIRFFAVQTTVSKLTAIIFATLINYTGRKYFIFHG